MIRRACNGLRGAQVLLDGGAELGRLASGRRCLRNRSPLLSISIGVATWTTGHPRSTKAVADIAAEMKGVAKRRRGSYVAVDERWDHQDVLGCVGLDKDPLC